MVHPGAMQCIPCATLRGGPVYWVIHTGSLLPSKAGDGFD